MKKNQLLLIGGIVLVTALVAGYSFLNKGAGLIKMPGEITKSEGEAGKEFTGRLQDIVKLGIPYKCTFSNNMMEGTGYIKGKNYYGEIKNSSGQEGYIIMKDNCMWNWNKDNKQGVKMCFDTVEGKDIFDQEPQGTPEGEYRCVPGNISDGKFTPPKDINFMDMDKMNSDMMQEMEDIQTSADQDMNEIDLEQYQDYLPEGMQE